MMLGKRPRAPIIRRTTSMSSISLDSDPQEPSVPHPHPDQPLVQDPYDIPTPHFLRTCGLCQRSLPPGRDIYMYRGDTAFCSSECREQRIKDDEKQHKLKVASKKQDPAPNASSSPSPKASPAAPETVAAA